MNNITYDELLKLITEIQMNQANNRIIHNKIIYEYIPQTKNGYITVELFTLPIVHLYRHKRDDMLNDYENKLVYNDIKNKNDKIIKKNGSKYYSKLLNSIVDKSNKNSKLNILSFNKKNSDILAINKVIALKRIIDKIKIKDNKLYNLLISNNNNNKMKQQQIIKYIKKNRMIRVTKIKDTMHVTYMVSMKAFGDNIYKQ